MDGTPASTTPLRRSLADLIEAVRGGLVCMRCGRYVGSLAQRQYLPPPYPVALDKIPSDDEAAALAAFEWHMVGLLREGRFTIAHPERDGVCISIREWSRHDEGEDGEDDEQNVGD